MKVGALGLLLGWLPSLHAGLPLCRRSHGRPVAPSPCLPNKQGIVKALLDANLLPRVVSGSSAGAIGAFRGLL